MVLISCLVPHQDIWMNERLITDIKMVFNCLEIGLLMQADKAQDISCSLYFIYLNESYT